MYHIPDVKRWGEVDQEDFDSYYDRWPEKLRHVPKCVIETWIYRHWSDYANDWLGIDLSGVGFELIKMNNVQVMKIGHISDWMKKLDGWGNQLFVDKLRQDTWLAKHMLIHGTWPNPIIVAPNEGNLEHPRGGKMMPPMQLIEGHMRLDYVRGMIRKKYEQLQPATMYG